MKKNKTTIQQRAFDELAPIIKYCKDHHGAMTELFKRLEKKVPGTIYFNQLHRWLNPDAKKRSQPSLGAGLIIIETYTEMLKEKYADIGVALGEH